MSIAILGANGRLGRMLCKVFPGAAALGRGQANLTRPIELRQALTELSPRVVINAAGFTQVDRAEAEAPLAFAVNATAMRDIAMICRDLDATLIHFSTNYVFGLDAGRTTPYTEDDTPGPINIYGNSKLAGEAMVRFLCPKHFILRTCGLHGSLPGQTDFVDLMLRLATQGRPIRVVDDQTCTPTSLVEAARAIAPLIDSRLYGVYHFTNDGACTWYEFARRIFEVKKILADLQPVRSDDYGAAASRPRYSVLDCTRWKAKGFTPFRRWEEALEESLSSR